MKNLYLDCFSGISGDMFLGAMIDLGFDPDILRAELAKLHLPETVLIESKKDQRSGIAGVKFDVILPEPGAGSDAHGHDHSHTHTHSEDEDHDHSHSHTHGHTHDHPHEEHSHGNHGHSHDHSHSHSHSHPDHEHHHGDHSHSHSHSHSDHGHEHHYPDHKHEHTHSHEHGRTYADIRHLIDHSHLSSKVKTLASAIFHRIAVAEAKIHGKTTDDVHFHEVGALDSIVDIIGAAVAIESMGITGIEASTLVEGTGSINCAHGRFPLPAPATLEILRGIPLKQIDVPNELITPTGAAILAELASSFSGLSDFAVDKIGYGLGSRNFPDRPNVLRALLGSKTSASTTETTDQVVVLESNLDDATGEELGHLAEILTQAGALDVSYAPLTMKKNRPGHLLQVIAPPALQEKLVQLLFSQSPAFGLRIQKTDRVKLVREIRIVETTYGPVRVKVGKWQGTVVQVHPEYDDCHGIALKTGIPLREITEEAKKGV